MLLHQDHIERLLLQPASCYSVRHPLVRTGYLYLLKKQKAYIYHTDIKSGTSTSQTDP